jgi:hypothetical protein
MSIVTIKEVKGVVKCAEDGRAEQVFNIKNATNKTIKIGMRLSMSKPVSEEWVQVDGPTEHVLNVEQMTQVSVKIQVPPDCNPGKYSYRLRVFDPDQPGEVFTDGDPVYFEVPPKKTDEVQEKDTGGKKIKWWIPAAIAAAVIVVGVVIWSMWPSGVKMPDFTQKEWTQAKAEKFLEDNKLQYTLELQSDPDPGTEREILGQVPPQGTKIKEGENVTLKIAAVPVPPLESLSFSAALQRIGSKGLSFDTDKDLKIQTVRQADQHEIVLRQDPKQNILVAKKSTVKLTVGRIANKRFEIKDISKLKTMQGIKMSPMFITREVQPASE